MCGPWMGGLQCRCSDSVEHLLDPTPRNVSQAGMAPVRGAILVDELGTNPLDEI